MSSIIGMSVDVSMNPGRGHTKTYDDAKFSASLPISCLNFLSHLLPLPVPAYDFPSLRTSSRSSLPLPVLYHLFLSFPTPSGSSIPFPVPPLHILLSC